MQEALDRSSLYNSVISIQYYDHIPSSEVAALVDNLGDHYIEVHTQRRVRPAMGQTYVDVAAVCLAFAGQTILAAFLGELAKAAWKTVSTEIYKLYRRAREGGDGYRYMRAFALETTVDGVRITFRITGDKMSQDQFEAAMEAARVAVRADNFAGWAKENAEEDLRHFCIGWDEECTTWRATKLYEPI